MHTKKGLIQLTWKEKQEKKKRLPFCIWLTCVVFLDFFSFFYLSHLKHTLEIKIVTGNKNTYHQQP